jgi:hypothetical protein
MVGIIESVGSERNKLSIFTTYNLFLQTNGITPFVGTASHHQHHLILGSSLPCTNKHEAIKTTRLFACVVLRIHVVQ